MTNEEVIERLDILISLSVPAFNEAKYPVTGLGLEVLRYADASHTVDDICKKIKKPRTAVDTILSRLRAKGLVKSVVKSSKTYYIRLQ